MKKMSLTRFVAIICLCLVSSHIKSEQKNCSTNCILFRATATRLKDLAAEPAKEDTDVLTYYGFYSKY
ncbi:hypothetical protein BH11BAC4_BH11BAC4_12930 [soil metagenome]